MAVNYDDYTGYALDKTTGMRHAIKTLPETAEWEEGIYQFENGDKCIGGVGGIDNLPIQQLVNRSAYLLKLNKAQAQEITNLKAELKKVLEHVAVLVSRMASYSSYGLQASSDRPTTKSAWVQPEGQTIATETPITMQVELEDGTILQNPTIKVTGDDGNVYYISTDGSLDDDTGGGGITPGGGGSTGADETVSDAEVQGLFDAQDPAA